MNLKETYNKIAEDWFKDHSSDEWWKEGTEKFLSLLSKESSILDVGCGAGVKSRYLNARGFKVTGIDFSEKFIDIAKKESKEINFDVMDIYEIDKYDKKFDAIFMQAVLLHIPRDKVMRVLENLKDKLNQGGLFYLAVKGKKDKGIYEETKKENDYGYEYERFFSYFSMDELQNYFENLNIETLYKVSNKVGNTEWLQIIGKLK